MQATRGRPPYMDCVATSSSGAQLLCRDIIQVQYLHLGHHTWSGVRQYCGSWWRADPQTPPSLNTKPPTPSVVQRHTEAHLTHYPHSPVGCGNPAFHPLPPDPYFHPRPHHNPHPLLQPPHRWHPGPWGEGGGTEGEGRRHDQTQGQEREGRGARGGDHGQGGMGLGARVRGGTERWGHGPGATSRYGHG